jgi:hypothetical protein
MEYEEPIQKWDIVKIYSQAKRKRDVITIISVGYTLLEMALQNLLRSNAGPHGQPLSEGKINKSQYLLNLAELALAEGFISQSLFDKIKDFNSIRRLAIHKLLTETVSPSEIMAAADSVSSIYEDIQNLWLKISIGPELKA